VCFKRADFVIKQCTGEGENVVDGFSPPNHLLKKMRPSNWMISPQNGENKENV